MVTPSSPDIERQISNLLADFFPGKQRLRDKAAAAIAALRATQPAAPSPIAQSSAAIASAWTPQQFWEYVEGLTDGLVRDQIRDMLAPTGLTITTLAQPSRITGARDQVEEAACLIWSELCPGMVMGDDDLPHYEAAAKAVLALSSTPRATPDDDNAINHSLHRPGE